MASSMMTVILFLASASATQPTLPGSCSFADEHLERVIDSDLIAKLPAVKLSTKNVSGHSGELIIAVAKIQGLDSLRLFGPLLTYCRNGTRMVQFDLVNERPLFIAVTLGPDDKLVTTAKLLRFTVHCKAEGSGQGLRLRRNAEVPVAIVLLSVVKQGSVGAIFESRFQEGPTDFWYTELFTDLETVFKQLLP